MLIWTTRFSRKKAILSTVIIGGLMACLIIFAGSISEETDSVPELTDNTQRIAYLQDLGWQVEEEPLETLQFLFPETLEEPYLSYNKLQYEQGFDLSVCCGKRVTRYTYAVNNYPDRPNGVQANLYVCENIPVAGDLCCPGANGFQSALIPQKSEQTTS